MLTVATQSLGGRLALSTRHGSSWNWTKSQTSMIETKKTKQIISNALYSSKDTLLFITLNSQVFIQKPCYLDTIVATVEGESSSRGSASLITNDDDDSVSWFSQSRQEHFFVQAKFVRKHSQYFRMHRLFLQAHPEPISLAFGLPKASGRFSKVASMAAWRCPPSSWCVFKQPTHVQVSGLHDLPTWKQVQYSLRQRERMQLQACSPGGSLAVVVLLPPLVKALGFRARMDWMAY